MGRYLYTDHVIFMPARLHEKLNELLLLVGLP